jgi:hypothetical protein
VSIAARMPYWRSRTADDRRSADVGARSAAERRNSPKQGPRVGRLEQGAGGCEVRPRPVALIPVHQTAPDLGMGFTKLERRTDGLRMSEAAGEQAVGAMVVPGQRGRSGTDAE